jgi:hypothetical protein
MRQLYSLVLHGAFEPDQRIDKLIFPAIHEVLELVLTSGGTNPCFSHSSQNGAM